MSVNLTSSSMYAYQNPYLSKCSNVNFRSNTATNYSQISQEIEEKKGMSTLGKVAIGSVTTLGAVALIDQFVFKGKYRKRIFDMFKKEATSPSTSSSTTSSVTSSKVDDIVTKKGLTYKDGNLYTGDVVKTSKGGNELKTTYKDGVVVRREYIPADKTEIQKIEKTYDNETHEGLKLVKGKITEADGTLKYSTQGYFTEHSFASEIESKIKMREFDKLKIGDYKLGKYDLGDGVELKVVNDSYYLYKDGKQIRHKLFFDGEGSSVTSVTEATIFRRSDNKYNFCSARDKLRNDSTYYDDGRYYILKPYDDSGKLLPKCEREDYDALGNRI